MLSLQVQPLRVHSEDEIYLPWIWQELITGGACLLPGLLPNRIGIKMQVRYFSYFQVSWGGFFLPVDEEVVKVIHTKNLNLTCWINTNFSESYSFEAYLVVSSVPSL